MRRIGYYLGAIGSGGIESATVSLCNYFDPNEIIVDFLVDSEDAVKNDYYKSIIEKSGGHIYCLTEFSNKSRLNFVSKIKAFYNIGRSGKFYGLHFHVSYPSSLLYGPFAKIGGCKKIFATSHAKDSCIDNKIFILEQKITRIVLPKLYSRLFAVSKEAGNWCYKNNDFIVIPNSIKADHFKYNQEERIIIRKELGIHDDEIVFGHIGRFAKDKNHGFIVRLYLEVRKKYPQSKLLFIGEGPTKNDIIKQCYDMGLNEKVIFQSFTPFPEKYFWAMDLFLFPSLAEGFGLVAVEAQAASLPIIASDNVPRDTEVSDLIRYCPLQLNEWLNTIDIILGKNDSRKPLESVSIKRYDVTEICRTLEFYYSHENYI